MVTAIVIDNDMDMVEIFSDYLMIKNIKVLGKGYNGRDAVNLYKKTKPNLAFIELVMPEYDGLYALEKIREFDPNAKVVIITESQTYGKESLKKLKPTGVFFKPFDISKILGMLTVLENDMS